MLLLTGEYKHTLDSKSRLLISNKLRGQIDAVEHGSDFYLVLGANGILCLYPEKYYERLVVAISPDNVPADEAVAFERMSAALTCKVELDSQGRLLLNENLRNRAGLRSSIALVGVRDHIEIWNEDSWDRYVSDHMAQYQSQMAGARKAMLTEQKNQF